MRVFPVAPDVNVQNMVANVDPMAAMAKGIDYAGQFARLGQLRSKIELEDAQRKADMAKSKATVLEANLMQRDLEDKFNIEKSQRELTLKTGQAMGKLADIQLTEAEGTAQFSKDMRAAARGQLAGLNVAEPAAAPAPAPAPTAPVGETTIAVPFKVDATLEDWIKPQVAAKILQTRQPVMSVSALAKDLGVKQEKRSFVDANSGAEYEADVLTGPAGEIFKVSEPRFVKASAMQAAVDKQFADDVADFVSGGAVKAQANINKLDSAISVLREAGTIAASGPIVGLIPEKVRKPFTTDKTLAVQKDIEQVIQESLKMILGAQFAQREAEQLLARSFDTSLSEEANADRVAVLKTQLQNAFDARTQAVEYFQKHGTLAGSKYTVNSPAAAAPPQGADLDAGLAVGGGVPTVKTSASDVKYYQGVPYKFDPVKNVYVRVR